MTEPTAGGIGKLIASVKPKFMVGDVVEAGPSLQEYATFDEANVERAGIAKIDLRRRSITQSLTVPGMSGSCSINS